MTYEHSIHFIKYWTSSFITKFPEGIPESMGEFSTKRTVPLFQFHKMLLIWGQWTHLWSGIPGGEAWKDSDHLLPTGSFFPLTAQSTFEPPSGMVNKSQWGHVNHSKFCLIIELGCDPFGLASQYEASVCSRISRKASLTLTKRDKETMSCCRLWRLSCDVMWC